jgi:phosphoglycolate phosphatase
MTNNDDWIVFDFDGTIADSFELAHQILNKLAERHGFRPVADSEVEVMRQMSMREFFSTLGISLIRLPMLAVLARRELRAHIAGVPPIAGIPEALQELKKKNIHLGILTSNDPDNVNTFLERHNLRPLFEFVHCSRDVFGKAHRVKALIRKFNLTPEQVIYVGDMDADIDAAHQSGIRVAGVTWGYQAQPILEKHNPTWLFSDPAELLSLVD